MKRFALLLVVVAVVLAGAALAWAMRFPEIAPIARPDRASFDRELVKRGEELAGLGNCNVCHTRTGGRQFAGGLALPTPFGVIYTTNITPDVETGIGAWSEQAFIRAMRQGVDRKGQHLYPAFPYDYFTRVEDGDLKAIYAYLMTQPPVAQPATANELSFPFNLRVLLAGWKLLFLDEGPLRLDAAKDDQWKRGAYLAEGLGHCGACHSPRNVFGAAAKTGAQAYSGGEAEGWRAPPLNASSPGPIPWTQAALVNYLIDGWDAHHGIAAGPMTPVVDDFYDRSEDDVTAIAAYVMSLKGGARPQAEQQRIVNDTLAAARKLEWGHAEAPPVPGDPVQQRGARLFETQCASCHKAGATAAPLALGFAVNAPDAANLINVAIGGIRPPRGSDDRTMPARVMSDDDLKALATFMRARFSTKPAWSDLDRTVQAFRQARSVKTN